MIRISLYKVIISMCLGALLITDSYADKKNKYIFARAPQLSSITLYNNWSPFVQYLSKELGVEVQLKLYKNRKAFLADVYNGRPDFVYMNPYYTINANARQGYTPVIRDSTRKLSGILVVNADSAVKSLKDLAGSEIAFPSPNALAASLYMRALLDRKHHIKFTPRYVGSHDNSYLHVMLNKVKAGGGVLRTFNALDPEKRKRLRILYTTPEINPHPISVNPRVPAQLKKKFTELIINMAKKPEGNNLLQKIHIASPIRTNINDYQSVKELQLGEYAKQH